MSEKNIDTWWGENAEEMVDCLEWILKDSKRVLEYIDMHRGNMSTFEVLEDIMCGSYVDEFADHSECDPKVCEYAHARLEKEEENNE